VIFFRNGGVFFPSFILLLSAGAQKLSFGCCVYLFETTLSIFDRRQRFVGDVLGQSFREQLPWDNIASIRINNVP